MKPFVRVSMDNGFERLGHTTRFKDRVQNATCLTRVDEKFDLYLDSMLDANMRNDTTYMYSKVSIPENAKITYVESGSDEIFIIADEKYIAVYKYNMILFTSIGGSLTQFYSVNLGGACKSLTPGWHYSGVAAVCVGALQHVDDTPGHICICGPMSNQRFSTNSQGNAIFTNPIDIIKTNGDDTAHYIVLDSGDSSLKKIRLTREYVEVEAEIETPESPKPLCLGPNDTIFVACADSIKQLNYNLSDIQQVISFGSTIQTGSYIAYCFESEQLVVGR